MALPLRRRATDDALAARIATGDESAAGELLERYRRPLERYAARLLGGSAHEAEDVVQDAFVEALRAIRARERPAELRPWLYRVVRNRAIDEVRRVRRRDVPLEAGPGDGGGGGARAWAAAPAAQEPAEVAGRKEALRELVRDLAELPERQRDALLTRVVDGASPQESAERLGVSVEALQMLVVRGREGLRQARSARLATELSAGAVDRQLRMLAPPTGILAAVGLANALGFGGLGGFGGSKAVTAGVAAVAVAAAAGGFAVLSREEAGPGEASPYALSGARTVIDQTVRRGDTLPPGTATVAARVQIPAGAKGRDDRVATLQCPSGMRYAAQLSHQTGQTPAVRYRPTPRFAQPRADGRQAFRFAPTVLREPAVVRIRILCRKPGAGGSLLANPRLPRDGEGSGTVCVDDAYLKKDPERLFVGTVFEGDRLTLTSRASRSVFAIRDDGVKGWIETRYLCPGWTSGGNARR